MRKPVFTDFLNIAPKTVEPIRSGPVQGPQKPTIANIIAPKLTREETAKADAKRAEAKAKKVLKPVRIGKDVYDYEFTGWDTMSAAQKQKALESARADILKNDPTADREAPNRYVDTKPEPYKGDLVTDINTGLGMLPLMRNINLATQTAPVEALSGKLGEFAKAINVQVPDAPIVNGYPLYDKEGTQLVADLTINSPSQLAQAGSDFYNKDTDNLGRVASVGQVGLSAMGAGQAIKAGKTAFDLARKTGSFGKALLKGVGAALGDSVGINEPDIPTSPKIDTAVTPAATDFASQQRALLRDVMGADDVSEVVPEFRQPISKMPEKRIESLSPQGRALESWAGSNLQKLIDNGVGEDLRTWDAVGKHYGAGAVPRNPDDFRYWVNDLVNSVDENDRTLTQVAEFGGNEFLPEMEKLRSSLNRSFPFIRKEDPVQQVVGIGRNGKLIENPRLYSLSSVPQPFRLSVLESIRDGEIRYTTRKNYQDWVDQGKPRGGVLRTRTASELATREMGGDMSLSDFVNNMDSDGGADIMVPRDTLRAFVRNYFDQNTRAGKAAAAMRKPVKPQDFENAIRHYNGETVKDVAPVVTEPVAVQAATTPVSTPKPVDMAPKPPESVTAPRMDAAGVGTPAVTEAGRTTGISNAANLSDFEAGVISRAPEGKGRSVKEIIETNKNRKDYDDVADRVAKGESYTADTAATVLIGKADYTAKVASAKNAIEQAILDGATAARIDELRGNLDDAIEKATQYAEKVQRGSSDWSDVGRTLATMLDYDTKDIATVLQEARIVKGSKLDRAEIEELQAAVDDLLKEVAGSKAEIERLMKAHADNAAKVATARKIVKTPEARMAKRKQALDEFMAATAGLNAYVNPKVIKQFTKYVYTLIEDGARTVEDIIAQAAKDGVKADFEDVYAAMRTQVKESTLSDLQKEIAKTKRELRAEADAAAGVETPIRLRRQMTQEQKIKFREGALRNEVAKLDKQIADKKRLPKPTKITSDEIERLEKIRKAKKAELDTIAPLPKTARKPSQRTIATETEKAESLQKQIDKLQHQAKDGTLPAPKKREISDQIKALEQERRKALKSAQDASPEYQAAKDARQLDTNKKRLEEKLKRLEERIANKDYAEVSIIKNARKTDAELDKLRQKIRVKDNMVKAGIERLRPKTKADKVGNFLNEVKLLNVTSRIKDAGANAVKMADFTGSSPFRRLIDLGTSKYLDELPITKGTTVDRTQRILDKTKNRLRADAELIVKGADPDVVKKYGSFAGIGGKAAGLTDVPFKSYYYEWMSDAAADVKARKMLGKDAGAEAIATKREEILSNLDEHPDIQLMAEEYSLNQTFNNSNWASETVGFWKKKAGNSGAVFVDEFLGRFAKVITNVAIDATDRTGLGIIRGAAKLKAAKKLGNSLTVSERAIINDMITKGLTGMATLTLGYALGDKIIGTIKGERNKYIDFGDLEGIGGPMSPFLLGVIRRKSEEIKDPVEAKNLRLGSVLRLPLNTPLASNAKDLLDVTSDFEGVGTLNKLLARKLSNAVIPGVVRDIAERMDTKGTLGVRTGTEVEREKVGKEINPRTGREVNTQDFLRILKRDVQSKIPFARQKLPIKKTAEEKKSEKKNEKLSPEAEKKKWLK